VREGRAPLCSATPRVRRLRGPLEISRQANAAGRGDGARACEAPSVAARNIRRWPAAGPAWLARAVAPASPSNSASCRSTASAATCPAAVSPALVAADDGDSGDGGGVRDVIVVSRARAGGDGGGARSRRLAPVPVGGAHAVRGHGLRHRRVPRVDKIVGPGNRYVAAAKALVAADCGIDFYAGPTEIVIVAAKGRPTGSRRTSSPRPSTIRMRGPCSSRRAARWRRAWPSRCERACRPTDRHAHRCRARRHHRHALRRRGHRPRQRGGAEHLVVDDDWMAAKIRAQGRCSSAVVGPGGRRLRASARTTCCPRPARRACVAACRPPTSCVRSRCSGYTTGLQRIGQSVIDLATAEGTDRHAESIAVRLRRT
jgi:hypothetical protein